MKVSISEFEKNEAIFGWVIGKSLFLIHLQKGGGFG